MHRSMQAFFLEICDEAQVDWKFNYPRDDLAKFGYKQNAKVEKFMDPSGYGLLKSGVEYYWWFRPKKGLNLMIGNPEK
jgi:hypothetical protein